MHKRKKEVEKMEEPGGLFFQARLALGDFKLDASFAVKAGETVSLIGPSGSGKTTCIRLIAGAIRPDQAKIALGDETLCDTERGIDLSPDRRHAAWLFQEDTLFPHLTVRGNIAYGPRARKRSKPEIEETVSRWIERLHLEDLADQPVKRLSGGQRQRVALARSLASDARILLLDEPFSALDVQVRSSLRSEMKAHLTEFGLPAVVVSHDPVDALVFGDRLYAIEDGKITQEGSREEMLTAPRTSFVAALAGLNLYRARIAEGRDLKEARVGDAIFHVLADDRSGDVYLAFAPSEVTLSLTNAEGSARNVFHGSVLEMHPLPDRWRVILDVGFMLTAEVTREAAEKLAISPGRSLWATVKATAIKTYV